MRIVHILAPTFVGGLERVVESLAVGHHNRGHDVTVIPVLIGQGERHPFVGVLNETGVTVRPVRVAPRAYLRERRNVSALCRSLAPEIVHTHGLRVDIADSRVAASAGAATVTTIHGPSRSGFLGKAVLEPIQRRSHRQFDAVIAVSSSLYEAALSAGVSPERLYLIRNGWSGSVTPAPRHAARAELGLPPEANVVGWVGRMVPVKGGDVFLEAFHRVRQPHKIGAIIGFGPESEALRIRAAELGLNGSVRFYPEIWSAGRLFSAFDVFVISSRSEGWPIVMLEAMASGAPLVATRVGGVVEALTEREAWLVPAEDPAALAGAIDRALTNRVEARERARRATQRLSEYDGEVFLDQHLRVYQRVLAEGAGHHGHGRA